MPDVIDLSNGAFSWPAVVSSSGRDLQLHLVQAAIQDHVGGARHVECDFPGYSSRSRVFRRQPSSTLFVAGSLHCRSRFTRSEDGEVQNVCGCIVSWKSQDDALYGIHAANFFAPVPLGQAGDSCDVSLTLSAATPASGSPSPIVIAGFCIVLSWKGGSTLYALSGQDKALMETTLGCLDGLLRRDSTLSDLSRRSERSRVPLVPPGDAELLAAVTLVRQRLATLLAAAT